MPHTASLATPPLNLFWILLNIACWGGCLLLGRALRRPWRRALRWTLRALLAGLIPATLLLLLWSSYCYWFYHRAQPAPETRQLFAGVTYIRDVRRAPRPLVIHVVKIDLQEPRISFLTTPPDPYGGMPFRARTTAEFLQTQHLDLAINGNFFLPFYSNNPFDFYPRAGQPVGVLGVAASRGKVIAKKSPEYGALNISAANDVAITTGSLPWFNALAGDLLNLSPPGTRPSPDDNINPRTAAGLDAGGKTLILVLVDGRQPNYSEGVSLAELGLLMKQYGATRAINLDGGGSTTLVVRDSRGKIQTLNSPIHTGIPHRQRPVGNHLGLQVR